MTFQPVVVSRIEDAPVVQAPGAVQLCCAVCAAGVVVEPAMLEYVPDRLLLCAQCALPMVMIRGQA